MNQKKTDRSVDESFQIQHDKTSVDSPRELR